ncbi:MAG TPA: 4Fe-4S binding protein [bacterium]|nr:4Fe-4S binding protein [bacterium]
MIDSIFKSKWVPVSFQVFTLCIFIFLIYIGWGISTDDNELLLILRNTNLANLVVWSFWLPCIILVSVLFGRLWCTVCPMELMASLLNRVGLKKKLPSFLKKGWAITFLYAVVLIIGVHTFKIHRFPHRMALYMIILFGLTIVLSFIFEKRAYCTAFCPIGHLLGLYSTNALMEWRVKNKGVCNSCKEKPCINKNRDYAWYGRACQSYLFPGTLKDNRDCILCTQCMKACPNDNVTFRFRKPFKDLFGELKLTVPQAGFILIVFGFAFYEVVTEWGTSKSWILSPFQALNDRLGITSPWDGTVTALLLFFIAPLVLFTLTSFLHSSVSKKGVFYSLKTYITPFIPLIATTHFAKAVIKSVSRFQNIPGALKDPLGMETARALHTGAMYAGNQWQYNMNKLAQVFSLGILALGFFITLSLLIRLARNKKEPFPIFYVILSTGYILSTAVAIAGKAFF